MNAFYGIQEFISTVQAKSFAQAAVNLGLTPSAVSKAVARLESSLGVRLLTRTTRSLSLTVQGQEFHALCERMLADFDHTRELLVRQRQDVWGTVRLDVPTSLGTLVIAPHLISLAKQHPDLQIEMSFSERISDLAANGTDIAVRLGDLPDSSLVARSAGRFDLLTCASPSYVKRCGTPQTPEDLLAHETLDFFFPQTGRLLPWVFEQANKVINVPVQSKIRLNHGEALLGAALNGAGIVHLPRFIAQRSLEQKQLVKLLPKWHSPGAPISVVYPRHRQQVAKVAVCVEFLLSILKSDSSSAA